MCELLDFTGRKDFEDLKFGKSYNLTQDDIVAFKEDCMRIKNTNDKMALEQCKLGLQLAELKAGKTWQSVINQKTGFAYLVQSFEDFCKDTFKFSGTKTYALMQIAKFVTSNSENEVHFIDEKYSEFSSSQLTELASVPSGQRHYFTSDMTIEQMRLVKKYIVTDAFWYDKQKEDFDLLTYAKAYVESKRTPKALPASKPDVLPGQQSIFPEDNDDGESEIFPISGKSEPGEEIEQEYIPERDEYEPDEGEVWQGGGLDYDVDEYDEADEAQEDMRAEMETIEQEAEKAVSGKQKVYTFTTRDEIRYFLEDYKNWNFRDDFRTPFGPIGYLYTLKTFDIINVMEVEGITNENLVTEAEELEGGMPLYFLYRAKYPNQPSIMVGKRQLENYLMNKRDVLQGV